VNPSHVGFASFLRVACALREVGWLLWAPLGDFGRADLIIEDTDGRLFRVQCKTGRLRQGAMVFPTATVIPRCRSGSKTRRIPYRGQAEFFGVYCPDNDKCYLIPVNDLPIGEVHLRVDPPRNGQRTRLRWAQQYEIGAVAQLGARRNGIAEVTGSIPVGSTSPANFDLETLF
jgi:hypothetical protein